MLFTDSLVAFPAPKPYGTKVVFAVATTASNIILDYVIRRLNALLTRGKGWLEGLTFAETPLARSPDSPGASRATDAADSSLKMFLVPRGFGAVNLETERRL